MDDVPSTKRAAPHHARQPIDRSSPEKTLRTLMDDHGDDIYRFCLSMLRQPDLAQDMLQQTFIKAYKGLADFEGRSSPRTWLYTIARRQCLDEIKKNRRHLAVVEYRSELPASPSREDETTAPLDADRLRQALTKCLEKVSPNVRTSIVMRFAQECSFSEMAQVTGASPKTLQSQVARALPAIRTCLKNAGAKL